MTQTASDSTGGVRPPTSGSVTTQPDKLRGQMGVTGLAITALAYNAPLAIVAGLIPIIVGYGNGLGAPLTFLAMGALLLVFAAGLNAMSIRMVRPGAFYTYIAHGLGRPAGLAAGFLALITYIAIAAGAYALFAVLFDEFAATVLDVSAGPWWISAVAAWAVATGLSLLNVEVSAKVLGVAMFSELVIVLLWNVRVFWLDGPEGREVPMLSHAFDGSLALAFLFVAICMTGFESLHVFREETRDPNRTVPRATYLVVAFLAVLYAICTYAYIVSEGPSNAVSNGASDPAGSAIASFQRYIGSAATDAASLLTLTSTFAAVLAGQNIAARYLYALGRDRVVPAQLGRVHARHGSPMVAAAASGLIVLAILLISVATGDPVRVYTVLQGLGAYCLIGLWVATSVAVFAFFRAKAEQEVDLFSSTIAPILSAAGLAGIFILATIHLGDLVGDVQVASVILALIAAITVSGALLALWWRKRDTTVYERIGGQDVHTAPR